MSPDFKDLLSAFTAHGVEFLVVGAHALAAHGYVRATKDLDLWIRPEHANALRVIAALRDFGAPLHDLTAEDLSHPGMIFQIGVDPLRIDLLTQIDGVVFEEAWLDRVHTVFEDQPANVLSRRLLIANKRTTARPQDLSDVKWLEQHSQS